MLDLLLKSDLSDFDKDTIFSLEEFFWAYASSPLISSRKKMTVPTSSWIPRATRDPSTLRRKFVEAAVKVLLASPNDDLRPPLADLTGLDELCGDRSPLKPRNLATLAL